MLPWDVGNASSSCGVRRTLVFAATPEVEWLTKKGSL